MSSKWFWIVGYALFLAGLALSSCAQPGSLQTEYPLTQPTQTSQPHSVGSTAPVTPAKSGSSIPSPSISAAGTVAVLTPEIPAGKMFTIQAGDDITEAARADLAERFSLPPSEIELILVIGQEFTPDAFYCRTGKGRTTHIEPGESISGQTILLQARGIRYEYHTDGKLVTFCRQLR